jgi:23S rRNA pseudouridine1911/1915/1917 synthase
VLASRYPEHSRSVLQRLAKEGQVELNGAPAKPNTRLKAGDEVRVGFPPSAPSSLEPEDLPLEVLFEDADLLVVNKASGMVVHPAAGVHGGTLVNAVLAHCGDELSRLGGEDRPGIVHRLDKDTSGLILVAKTDRGHRSLAQQIHDRTASRVYLGILWGTPRFTHALIDAPIGRHPTDRKRRAVAEGEGSRNAATELEVVEVMSFCTLVRAKLRTGRTHQIRVHCSHVGHPVLGDPLYGGVRQPPAELFRSTEMRTTWQHLLEAVGGQALHAAELEFDHPVTGERLHFEAPLPRPTLDLIDFLRGLGCR